ncbi:MAG: antitoxin [bacterium]|nr:antitoxin [bacterium]
MSKNQILTDEEQKIENSLEQGNWKSISNLAKQKKELQKVAAYALDLRKSKRITFRVNQGDLVKLKAKAMEKNIPYQTLLSSLIRSYVEKGYSFRL